LNPLSFLWNEIIVGSLERGLLGLYFLTGSYGIAIILFTVVVRLLLFPLNVTSLRSMRRMQEIAPLLKELQKKYKGDRQAMAEAQMKLYKEYGVNPLGGCLPQLAQMPILFGLYYAITNTTQKTPDLATHFLWIKDLGQPDVWTIPGASFPLPGALALLAGATQWVLQRMMTRPHVDDPQQQIMQSVMQVMPLMIIFFAMSFPAGLALYWVVSNIFSVAQQYLILRDWGALFPTKAGVNGAEAAQSKPEGGAPAREQRQQQTEIPELTEHVLAKANLQADGREQDPVSSAGNAKSKSRRRERKRSGGKR